MAALLRRTTSKTLTLRILHILRWLVAVGTVSTILYAAYIYVMIPQTITTTNMYVPLIVSCGAVALILLNAIIRARE